MLVIPSGRLMEVREEQVSNASGPMLLTPSGMTIDVREEHS